MNRFPVSLALPALGLAIVALPCAIAASAFAQGGLPDGPITRTQVTAGVRRQFDKIDSNHDGVVTRAEFDAYRAKIAGQTNGDASAGGGGWDHIGAKWFDRADTHHDGKVTLDEAMARPLELFDMADANHDGVVSLKEREAAMMLMSIK